MATAVIGLLLVSCSDDDDTVQTLPPAPTTAPSTTPSTTETPPSGTEPPTPTTAPPTTEPAPTTTAVPTTTISVEEATKAEIDEAYVQVAELTWRMLNKPRLKNLERDVAKIATRDSPYFERLVTEIREMVDLNDRYIEGEPPIRKTVVERVQLLGEPPFSKARVTVCAVGNDSRVNVEPDGSIVYVGERGQLRAVRFTDPVRLTDDGWRIDRGVELIDPVVWYGVEQCPEN
jgi:hypothetical protein